MAAIISDLSGDKRIILGIDRFVRQPSFMLATNWVKIRIGMRICMSDGGGDLNGCNFWVGVCSGNTSIYGDVSGPAHAFGMSLFGNGFSVLARATAPTRYLSTVSGVTTTVAGVQTGAGADCEPATANIFCSDTSRTAYFVDITKGSPNFSATYFRNTSATATDLDKATFDAQVIMAVPTITNHGMSNASVSGVDEATNGYFDHINVYWSRSTTIKISDLTVVRLL